MFLIFAKNLSISNSVEMFVTKFQTRELAEMFCKARNYKINYYHCKNLDLIIKEI